MARAGRRLTVYLACCVAGLAVSPVIAMGEGSPPAKGSGASSSLGEPLVTQGSPVEGEEKQVEREAKLDNPEAVSLREESQTKYEGLDPEQAVKVAGEAFPALVNEPAGGPPKLPAGESIVGFPADNVAQIDLPGGKHGVIESTGPLAAETSGGQRVPVDLSLSDAGAAFEPKTPAVGVRIPKQLGEGVQLSGSGVSLTPATEQGSALGGSEGTLNGATVFYANTQTDTDTLAKPLTGGFELDSLLRSVESPEKLYFRVGMPSGATLVAETGDIGGARVVLYGNTIASIAAPSAQDAQGRSVPVSMSVSGDTLVVSIPHGSNEYAYPIEVDPRAYDYTMPLPSNCENYGGVTTDWEFVYAGGSFRCYTSGNGDIMDTVGGVNIGEHDEFVYPAHGQAGVAFIEGEMQASASELSKAWTKAQFVHSGSVEVSHTWANAGESFGRQLVGSCDEPVIEEGVEHCRPYNYENELRIVQTDTATENVPEGYGFWFELYNGTWVSIFQEKGPEVSFETFEATLASGRQNVLYGSGGWLGEHNGAIEITAKDPGLGVSDLKIKDLTAGAHGEHWEFNDPVYADGLCTGVWCNEEFHTNGAYGMYFTYNKEMAEGTNTFELCAEDEAAMKTCTDATAKVDNTPPSNVKLKGIAESGAEVNATPHQLTVEATDTMSGVKSIAVLLDGQEIEAPAGSCSPGECTASRMVTIDAESLGAGEHKLFVKTTDNADNVAEKAYTFAIRNATPVKVGPGTVDPVTGQFALGASDVTISGAGGVSRSYDSRSPATNLESPFGPQWNLSVGDGQSLKLLPDGSAELQGSGGEPTVFALNKEGKFEAPKGDGNMTLESKEKEAGKGITEYLLKDPAAGTTTTFTQPAGTGSTTPIYFGQFGAEGVQLNGPTGVATDSSDNVWVVDYWNSRIVKFSQGGTPLATYGSQGSGAGQFFGPLGITINQSTGDVYVADTANNRIEELSSSGAFIEAFGWGVTNGAAEFEVCKSSCQVGVAGSGNGQFNYPEGVAVDSSGNVWVADSENNRIEEFSSEGKYEDSFGTEGKGEGQFKRPVGIAFSGGNLYVAESGNNRVQELSTTGKYIYAWGKEGNGNGEFNKPQGIAEDPRTGNLYVVESGGDRVQEFTAAGGFVAKFGSFGSGPGQLRHPQGVAVNSGGVYVGDYENNRVQEWTHPVWLPTKTESTAPGDTRATSYRSVMVEERVVTEPIEELGPVPAGVTCGKNPAEVAQAELSTRLAELKAGCRALSFTYAEKTTATGEGASEWGEYNGRLMKVSFTGYNTTTKKMETIAVAQYAYDKQGRLRAEWNPRISPNLKTTYGYDTEGHVTALSPPGQQPWLLHYGAIAGDASTGRLLSTTRSGAANGLWNGEALKNTAAPTLSSTSPVIGTTMSVSGNGTWSNGPLAYTYKWMDCTKELLQCTVIAGATNRTYTPQVSDAGYTLAAQVTATNAGGSVVGFSAETSVVPISAPKYSLTFGSTGTGAGQTREPMTAAIDASGNVWVADNANNRIDEFSSAGTFSKTLGFGVSNGKAEFESCTSSCQAGIAGSGNGQFSGPWGITVNQAAGDIYVSDQGNARVDEFTTAGAFVKTFGVGHLDETAGVGVDPNGNVWVANCAGNNMTEFNATGGFLQTLGSAGSGAGQFSCPGGFAFVGGNMYVADFGNKRIQKFSLTGAYLGQFASVGEPYDINENQVTGEIYETDLSGKVDEFNQAGTLVGSFGTKGTGSGQFERPTGLAVNASGDIYVVDHTLNRLEEWTPTYSTNNPVPEPPSVGTSSVSTIEYRVPLSGSGAPHEMTSAELAKWGQTKDPPHEATAIFPPDEPMGWPATDYKRAAIGYMDAQARQVDAASPSTSANGAISTTEYNSLNEVTRTLSADNRATALKEGSKSAEVAEHLSSEKLYNGETLAEKEQEEKEVSEKKKSAREPGARLRETFGPEHKIKLPSGTEEETRDRQKFFYNEGAPSKGETYNLPTKVASWTEGAVNKEREKHEKTLSYSDSAEGELGWTLRKPVLVTEKVNKEQTSTATTTYSAETGNALETTSSVSAAAPVYMSQFGSKGTAGGQFENPERDAVDSHGDVWITDYSNHRIEELSSSGTFMLTVGWGVKDGKAEAETCTASCQAGISGSGNGQFEGPLGIAVNQSSGNIYVSDYTHGRVEELSSTGIFVVAFGAKGAGAGQFESPEGVAVDASGDVWVADAGNNRIEEFSSAGTFMLGVGWGVKDGKAEAETCTTTCEYGKEGSGNGQMEGPADIALSSGHVYVTDFGNKRVDEFSSSGAYVSKFGSKGTGNGQFEGVYGIASDPESGDLYVSDEINDRIQQFTPFGTFVAAFGSDGSGKGQFVTPFGVAVNASGDVYIVDHGNNRIEEWEPVPAAPVFTSQFGSKGTAGGQFESPARDAVDTHGDVWVTDRHNHRVDEFSSAGTFMLAVGWGVSNGKAEAETCTSSCEIGISGSGSGQFSEPWGIAVNQSSGDVYVSDTGDERVQEFSSTGTFITSFGSKGAGAAQFNLAEGLAIDSSGNVWVADQDNWRIDEFSSSGTFMMAVGWGVKDGKAEAETCTTTCEVGIAGSGSGQLDGGTAIAFSDGNIYVTDYGNRRVDEFSPTGTYISSFGGSGTGNGKFEGVYGIATDPTTGNLYVGDSVEDRVQMFTPSGTFIGLFGSKGSGPGQFISPQGIAVNSTGVIYVVDAGNSRMEGWTPAPRSGNEGAHDTHTVYYTAKGEAEVAACQNHPEWANLVCQTGPAVQPGDSGPPPLPVTTTTYNTWDEPEVVTEQIGSVTRTTTKKYDGAGRETSSEETSTASEDKALPAVTDEYSSETGALVKLTSTIESKARTVTSVYNTLGQLTSYTDAEGSTTKYSYDIDGRVEEVTEPKGKQIYAYDPTTGLLTKLLDSAAGTFTATYDVEGKMLTEGYPNGMAAKYAYNSIGQATNLEYEKTTHCTEKCVWFSDAEAFGPEGELATQASTLSKETYSYSEAGQLIQTKEESPTGASCIEERAYGYNESTGERLSLETRKPNSKGECTSEGGVVEGHDYDVVGRLLDPGVTYDALGNMTKVPALDAGGSPITSSFYVDNQAAVQEQNEKSITYTYDPVGRTMVAKTKTTSGTTTAISHYAGPGNALTWTCEEAGECKEEKESKWTRSIPGIDGALDAIQTNGETPVLQLHDLQGNIIATALLSETATELFSKHNTTEFGVPVGTAPKYSWLGANGAESELGTGVITTAGATYVPQLAHTLQTEQVVPPGAAPNGVMDTEAYQPPELPWTIQSGDEGAANTVAEQRTLEAEAKKRLEEQEHEPEDPIDHYRAWEAKTAGEESIRLAAAGDLVGALGTLFGTLADFIDGYVLSEGIVGTALGWIEDYGKLLVGCVDRLHSAGDSHGGCRAQYYNLFWEGSKVPDFWSKASISECKKGAANVSAINGLELSECTLLAFEGEGSPIV